MKNPAKSRAPKRLRKKTSASKRKRTVARKPSPEVPPPAGWMQQGTPADFLLRRGEEMRQRFIDATGSGEVFVPAQPAAGGAPQSMNATLALSIAKAQALYEELHTSIGAAEATLTELMEAGTAHRGNQPAPLTTQEAGQITNIFVTLRQQQAVPIQVPDQQVRADTVI
jgi:hypothetical protein